jgi:hypothetical protein
MPDNTNVNNNASVVVVGRTAPVPPGQQKSDKSVPVVIASDQSTIPVAEQNKVQSEVALSLLGIPRSEVALGIFADVNTYDVNPTEWAAEPDQFSTIDVGSGTPYAGVTEGMGWGLTHVPEESGALVEAPADKTAVLTSKRFFRYQPGRVSAATFGVKTTIMNIASKDIPGTSKDSEDIGASVFNPAVRKYGIFDNFDGYYWETRNNGQGDNFCVVRRTQSLLFNNPVEFSTTGQTADFGATNPLDVLAPRGNETDDPLDGPGTGNNAPISFLNGQFYPDGHDSTPTGYRNVKLGDLVIYRDNLMMTHAGVYDPSILQDEQQYSIQSANTTNDILSFDVSATSGTTAIGKSISDADYDIDTGLMTVTTHGDHGFAVGKFVHLSGIGMTCQYSYVNPSNGNIESTIQSGGIKYYPDRTHGYNILRVDSSNKFTVNVGVSTVATFFNAEGSSGEAGGTGAVVLGLSTSQYVSYSKGVNTNPIGALADQKIYRVNGIAYDKATKKANVKLRELTVPMTSGYTAGVTDDANNVNLTTTSQSGHSLITPVPFVQPIADNIIRDSTGTQYKKYGTNDLRHSGMFPYMYKNTDGLTEGYIDTTLSTSTSDVAEIKKQMTAINSYYRDWINQNVKKDFWNVYEYRVPRSRFSGDRLDNATDDLLYSDVTALNRAGSNVVDVTTGENTVDTSIWDLEFDKVTMYKIEFSWYGAVGALFLAYVPVGAGEARWVRVHHLRASNQLKGSSLGNATLPITYLVYGGGNSLKHGYSDVKRTPTSFGYGSSSEHIIKYGASYYIDGGDRGTVKLFSHGTPTGVQVFGSKRSFNVGGTNTQIEVTTTNAVDNTTSPYITGGSATALGSSYFVGAKVITGNPLDQNVEIVYVNTATRQLFLNVPLQSASIPGGSLDLIINRPTPLIGLKCRDFITSSQGKEVRNRTQVYPTRLSTGSSALIKVDLLKTPIFQTLSAINAGSPFILPANPDPTDATKTTLNIGKRGKAFKINVSGGQNFLANNNSGAYGYLRGRLEGDATQKQITVFGYLERRSSNTDYYFRAENPTTDNVLLIGGGTFLYEAQTTPTGTTTTPVDNDFTLDSLSSIKVSPELRAPIPKTGTIVASLFIPASGEEFDLSSYFDYNKEYLSFPLTNVVETLYVVGSSEGTFSGSPISTTNASITWEEQ